MAKILGGEVISQMLSNEGVDRVFGIIDGTYFGLYATLKKHGIELISPRHETCAVHMAAAYARVTGKLGVCIASNGPGVANALPGVAVENGEGNRVLLITSTRRVGIGYPDRGGAYQYFNQVAVTRPMTKWSGAVPSADRLVEFLKRAFRVSHRGRPGVVHVDVPESIINSRQPASPLPTPESYRRTAPLVPDPRQVKAAAEMLRDARLPLIHAGSGVIHAHASEELARVSQLLHAMVCTSWAARGVISETNPLALPMIYIKLNNKVRKNADVVLTVGSRIGETDWWGKAPNWQSPARQRHIQLDIDDDILGLNKPVDLAIVGDAKVFLNQLAAELEGTVDEARLPFRRQKAKDYGAIQRKERTKLDKILTAPDAPLTAAHVATTCQRVFDDDAYLVVDGGNTAVWANFYHEVRTPATVLSTPKFGMLGAGIAQTLAAKIAKPARQVYCIIGDGAMGFHPQEIETAVRQKLAVVYIVCCDRQWGMVKMNQQFALRPLKTMLKKSLSPEETINADLGEIRFDELAASMGAHGERVSHQDELQAALERSIASGRCAVVHVDVEPVRHMWAPSLLEFKRMHQEPKGR